MSAVADAAAWLASTPLAGLMRTHVWMYPIVQIIHILGFIVLVGGAALFDLRVLGFAPTLPVAALGRHLLPWSVAGAGLALPAGLLLFMADPHSLAANPAFLAKLTLIACAGVNALLFHAGPYRSVSQWNVDARAPLRARMQALLSVLLWLAIVSCGRLLAYV